MDIKQKWLMNEKMTTKQREIVLLMMKALEIPMYGSVQSYERLDDYPYLRYLVPYGDKTETKKVVCATRATQVGTESRYVGEQLVTYEELFTALKDELTIKSKEVWNSMEPG